jgi:hypothetical protein
MQKFALALKNIGPEYPRLSGLLVAWTDVEGSMNLD